MTEENLGKVLRDLVEQQNKVAEALEKSSGRNAVVQIADGNSDDPGQWSAFSSGALISAAGHVITADYATKTSNKDAVA